MSTQIFSNAQSCFDLSRDIDAHVGSMAASGERAVAGRTTGLIGLGDSVTWEARYFGLRWRATSRVTQFEPPSRFVDEMRGGPFSQFIHEHRFDQLADETTMVDVVQYRLLWGALGVVADKLFVNWYLSRLIVRRGSYIKALAEGSASSSV